MKVLELFSECWLEVTKQKRYHNKWLANKTLKFLLEQDRSIAHLIPITVYKNYLFLDLLPRVL
jgi:predicted nucleotidyltransferase